MTHLRCRPISNLPVNVGYGKTINCLLMRIELCESKSCKWQFVSKLVVQLEAELSKKLHGLIEAFTSVSRKKLLLLSISCGLVRLCRAWIRLETFKKPDLQVRTPGGRYRDHDLCESARG